MKNEQLPPDVIRDARAIDLVQLAESYGVKMAKQGKDFFGCCPFHAEDTPSFTIFRKDNGPQRFQCFGCGASGDSVQFVMDYEDLKFRDAVRRLVGNLPATGNAPTPAAAHVPAEPEEVWMPVMPVPDSAPMTPDSIHRKIKGQWVSITASRRWTYRNANGEELGHVLRFDLPGGGKEVLPLTWSASSLTGELQWRWLSFPKPRPMYGLDKLAENPDAQVLVVEGEKAADAAQELFLSLGVPMSKLVVVSWPGGVKAIKHVGFSPLADRAVALWPDADQKPYPTNHDRAGVIMPFLEQPGTVAMLDVWAAIRESASRVKFIMPPEGVPDGWDLADAPPPGFSLLAHIKSSSVDPATLVQANEPAEPVRPIDPVKPDAPATKPDVLGDDGEDGEDVQSEGYFSILGYNRETYYVFQQEARQIFEYTKGDFTDTGFIALAPLHWWETNFPSEQSGFSKKLAANWFVRRARARGIYDPSRTRGRGAWIDQGRVVLHLGNTLYVDGVKTDVTKIASRYVYELDRALPDLSSVALTVAEGRWLLDVAKMFRWNRAASAPLLAGWVALAPLCGAMKWRPHIWITGGAGSGKAQPHSAGVLTPTGWKTMGDIRVGDLMSTPDNGFARVRGLFPQGVKPVYKLTFADGRVTRATGDHLWKVRVKHDWRIRTTDEMREILGRKTRASVSLAIPLCEPMTVRNGGSAAMLPLHPYVLGIMLGDGSFGYADGYGASGTSSLTCFDPEIVDRARRLLEGSDFNFFDTRVDGQYRLGDLSRYGRATRQTIKDLRLLGTKSDTKFIPRAYLDASVADRIELLKGLMDTDGHAGDGGSISYCTTSERLRDDFIELVRSLGGMASYSVKIPTYTYNGEKRTGLPAYNINIRLRDPTIAFSLQRKLDRVSADHQYADCLYLNVASIELDGEEECSCIAIDHPDRLYVTDSFVVTHNTSILNEYVHALIDGIALFAQGNSTEAGIRQTLHTDARPVLFDESESNEEKDRLRIQGVLSMIRQASSESAALTLKGTSHGASLNFHVRSMFALASIQVALKHQADMERLAVLALRQKRAGEDSAADQWRAVQSEFAKIRNDETLPGRLFRRSVDLLPVTMQNIAVFTRAAAEKFGSQRDGDQYGTLMAGAWSLQSDALATPKQAREMLDAYDWDDHMEHAETNESQVALGALMGAMVSLQGGAKCTIHELVMLACGRPVPGAPELTPTEAGAALKRLGLKAEGGSLLLANRMLPPLEEIMRHSQFAADLRGQLLRLPGAARYPKVIRFGGALDRGYSIPLQPLLDETVPGVAPPSAPF